MAGRPSRGITAGRKFAQSGACQIKSSQVAQLSHPKWRTPSRPKWRTQAIPSGKCKSPKWHNHL
ncbi:hypothetical protein JCGZ_00334 [Jatropha curcas]|uniref:Uncharacterized protein n=1 Tax=Jatropha curcas TaxID=180498 RepID=A0A067JT69_JATCU|nr:hypothetical protein JCGZ_00334 [Jatropha curcas]